MRSILLIGLALLLSACGSTGGNAAAAHPSPSASSRPGGAGRGALANGVAGKLAEVNDTNLVLTTQTGRAAVTYDQSTPVLRSDPGTAADIVAGTCVTAAGQGDTTSGIAATTVQVMLNMNGNCALPATGRQSPLPNGAGGGGAATRLGAFVRGKVAAVSGATFTVQPTTGSPVTVTLSATTRVTRLQTATTGDLAVGQCLQATGPRDASGAIQARQLTITQPNAGGTCGGAGLGGGFGPRPTGSPGAG